MGTPMISAEWPRFILPIIRKEWYQKISETPSAVAGLFSEDTSTSSVEYSQGIGGIGVVPEYNSATAEGAPASIQYTSFDALYEKTFTHKEYAQGIAIERKLFDDDRGGMIRRRAQGLGLMFASTVAYHQSSVFNNAFTDSAAYHGGDSKPLCSTTHPTSPSNSTAIVNAGTTALSYTAINTTLAAGLAMTADDGTPMPVVYDTLLVPVGLKQTALEVIGSSFVPGQADLTASALAGQPGLRVVVDPRLTDANNWFMIDSAQARMHLLWFWRVRPEINIDPASNFNLVARYAGYMRYSFGWDDFRWVYGHNVT